MMKNKRLILFKTDGDATKVLEGVNRALAQQGFIKKTDTKAKIKTKVPPK